MSIQQNVNQLLTMAGTAAMLSPQLRQKAEDRTKLGKLDKEESSLNKLQESDYKVMKSKEYAYTTKRINELKKIENPSDDQKTELSALQNERAAFHDARDERFNRLFEIATERAEINPTPENIEEARTYRTTVAWKKTLEERKKRKREEAMEHMRQEGQNKLDQKTEFEKFRESLSSDDNFHSLSPAAQKIAYEQYTKGGK
jgi:hypothetical protein